MTTFPDTELDPGELAELAFAAATEADELIDGDCSNPVNIEALGRAIRAAGRCRLGAARKVVAKGYCGYVADTTQQDRCLDAVMDGSRSVADLNAFRDLCLALHDALLAGEAPSPHLLWGRASRPF